MLVLSKMSKKQFILDLDQTLISAEATEDYNFTKNSTKAKQFNFHNMDNLYIVFERPYLQPFLDYLFKNFDVSIWTAATKSYALFVIEKIILANRKDRQINYIFFSYHCDISEKLKNGTKDLSLLWDKFNLTNFNEKNTLILDDYERVYEIQPKNCIFAKSFDFKDPESVNDDFLNQIIPELEKIKNNKNIQLIVEKYSIK